MKKIKNQISKGTDEHYIGICRHTRKEVHIELVENFEGDQKKLIEIVRRIAIHKHLNSEDKSIVPILMDLIYKNGNLFIIFDQYKSNLKNIMQQD